MLKKFAILFLFSLALGGAAFPDGDGSVPFSVGEVLTYQIYWGPFVVGRATLEVAGIEPIDGHDCYHLIAKAKTGGIVQLLFPVDSTAESWLDRNGLFSRLYREDRMEGKHHRKTEIRYDYAAKEMINTNQINGHAHTTLLDQHVLDVISSLYVVRTEKLLIDAEESMVINSGGTNFTVTIRPDLRKPIYVHSLGDVQALRIEPTPTLDVVSANKGHMWFWISDDARRLPLLVNSELKYGTAKLILFSVVPGASSSGASNKPASAVSVTPAAGKVDTVASER